MVSILHVSSQVANAARFEKEQEDLIERVSQQAYELSSWAARYRMHFLLLPPLPLVLLLLLCDVISFSLMFFYVAISSQICVCLVL